MNPGLGRAWCTAVLAASAALPLRASALPLAPQAVGMEQVEVRVISVQGQLVQIDRGKEAGLEPGDRVRLRPLGQKERFGRVQSVAERTAWVVLTQSADGEIEVDIGTSGYVELPPSRRREEGVRPQPDYRDRSGPLPESEPVWTTPVVEGDPNRPLLEQLGTRPDQRPMESSGRFWMGAHAVAEREFRDHYSLFARAGLDWRLSNPAGHGGEIHTRFEFDFRAFDAEGEPAETEPAVRLERLSYRRGGQRHETRRLELGRFLQHGFPELGLLDGVELQWGRPTEARVGVSAGWIPEATQELTTGNDFQLALFYRDQRGGQQLADTRVSWGAAVQQTWHDGERDRQLLLLQADLSQGSWYWRNSAWLDVYDSRDLGKDEGMEPTLAYSMLHWNGERHGASLGVRHWRYPRLLRFQAGNFPQLDLFEDRTTRFDLSTWWRVESSLRLRARLDHWSSRDRDGNGAELRADFDDLLAESLRSGIAVFQHDGSFTEVLGLRVDQQLPIDGGLWRVFAERAQFDERFSGEEQVEHELRVSWFQTMNNGWNLDLDVAWRFGDDQDSPSVSFFLSRAF